MADAYTETLEHCIGMVLAGVSIDVCVGLHPETANELRQDLATFKEAFDAYDREPSAEAFERSRQRLATEFVAMELAEAQVVPAPSFSRRLRLAWAGFSRWHRALSMAAAVLVLLLLGASAMFAASSNALPGDTLYATKLTFEEVRLTLTPSKVGKADLQLAFADRRAAEATALIARGDYSAAQQTAAQINEHLTQGAALAESSSPNAAKAFARELNSQSTSSLARMDQAVAAAPAGERAQATDAASVASAGYANAAEQIAGPTYVAAGPGTMQLWAADPPPPGVDEVLVQISGIEGYLAAGDNSRWVSLASGQQSFDLVRVANEPKLLATTSIDSGTYTRFRFTIDQVTVVTGGTVQVVKPTTTQVELRRNFSLAQNGLTPVYLDFDGGLSVSIGPNGGVTFDPVVAARASVANAATQVAPTATPQPTPTPTVPSQIQGSPTPTPPVAQETPTPPPVTVTASGTVVSVSNGSLLLDSGLRVSPALGVQLPPTLGPGTQVQVAGHLDDNGVLIAQIITLGGTLPSPTPTPPNQIPQPTPTPVAPTPTPTTTIVTVTGLLEPDVTGVYLVGGHTVRIGNEAQVSGALSAYSTVQVTGAVAQDGSIDAISVTVIAPPNLIHVTGLVLSVGQGSITVGSGQIAITSSTQVTGILALGANVEVTGVRRSDGVVVATSIDVVSLLPGPTATATPAPSSSPTPSATPTPTGTPSPAATPTPTPTPTTFIVEGLVTVAINGHITVDGQDIVITPQTSIGTSQPLLDSNVRVEGHIDVNGEYIADTISVL